MVVIKKRVSLEFLGDEYANDYLIFKSIPVKEYDDLKIQIKKIGDDEDKSLPFIISQLELRFIDGEAGGEKLVANQLTEFPGEVFLKCWESITGQADPKVQTS